MGQLPFLWFSKDLFSTDSSSEHWQSSCHDDYISDLSADVWGKKSLLSDNTILVIK